MKTISHSKDNEKRMSYNEWCIKLNVGSMYTKPDRYRYYKKDEYDYDKFIKMIQKNDKKYEKITIWKQISKALFALRSRKM